jgi:diguanylate cyclase (GGDEF)-like protein
MKRHVVLLTDAYEAPATALTDVLQGAGIAAFVEGIREVEATSTTPSEEDDPDREANTAPLAVLYEVFPGADMRELYSVIEHANAVWPNVPLVACRRQMEHTTGPRLRTLDTATLKRIGFRAIADEPAQLPALLRELEDRGMTGELPRLDEVQKAWLPESVDFQGKIRTKDLREAFELVVSLHFTSDQISAANAALAGLAPLVEAGRWTIYLTSEATRSDQISLEPLAVRESSSAEPLTAEQDLQRALLGKALALSGSESRAAREAVSTTLPIRKTEKGQRVVAVPLVSGDRVMGVIEGVRHSEPGQRAFTRSEIRLLDALALPIAFALGNSLRIAEAERLSQTDDLTKLHNARFLRQFVLAEVRRARRYGSSVGALFFDLDDFKNVNDMHGHLVGSHVLMEMAAVILSSVRDTDIVARYGGDEFVVILPESNIDQAAFVAERVRQKIERNRFAGGRGLNLRLTASFGVATFPLHAQSPQQLVANADAAMYEAKAAGKNCLRFPADLPSKDRAESITDQRKQRSSEESPVS